MCLLVAQVREKQTPCAVALAPPAFPDLAAKLRSLAGTVTSDLLAQRTSDSEDVVHITMFLHLR